MFLDRFALRFVAGLCVALLLAACGGNPVTRAVSGVFGGGDDEEENAPEKDERISILALEQTLEPDPRLAGVIVETPPSYRNISWPQPGGEADHTLHHLSGALALEVVWRADIGAAGERARLTAPPVAADGRLFVIDAAARVSALDLETGERLWRAELTPSIKERFRIREIFVRPDPEEIGFGGGVAYDGGRLFVTSGFGFVAALDAATGEEIWRVETAAPARTPPTAYRGAVYVVTNTNELLAFDQETGERRWSYQSFEEAARFLSSASPAAAGDLVVAPFSSGEVAAFLADSGRPVWNETLSRNTVLTALSRLNDIAGSPVIDRGLVFAASHGGRLSAIDIRTGRPVWELPVASLQMPWVAGDYLYLVSVDAELICVQRETGAIVWISQLRRYEKEKKRKGRIAWAGPVLVGDHLVLVSSRGDIVKASPLDGAVVERERVGDGFMISPIVVDEKIFVLNEKGKLVALR
ncbi:outer membrane protein assembly factor BamB family protein [Amphiplicatus metriothermophilus]|uniref:Outer membrane protein assembly factor BamB n=1 Tax=Amphiplicatus metriothermophilus TaxID=1519374 RepID=A0A239PSH9_9PROT|nr:PQQ-binding-like beta-propeller repeat protein [Amphiplicatus metriothermophilus]MBB5519170.1 outer membrane protein assembly factor BamB [Amphiplicatus metriothermophilus]SNT73239.1 Outer membrane protein assembly factor BamB, contains PQQ-like beta-propeller repeat [Amphiplicatus metriothermophilus]